LLLQTRWRGGCGWVVHPSSETRPASRHGRPVRCEKPARRRWRGSAEARNQARGRTRRPRSALREGMAPQDPNRLWWAPESKTRGCSGCRNAGTWPPPPRPGWPGVRGDSSAALSSASRGTAPWMQPQRMCALCRAWLCITRQGTSIVKREDAARTAIKGHTDGARGKSPPNGSGNLHARFGGNSVARCGSDRWRGFSAPGRVDRRRRFGENRKTYRQRRRFDPGGKARKRRRVSEVGSSCSRNGGTTTRAPARQRSPTAGSASTCSTHLPFLQEFPTVRTAPSSAGSRPAPG